MDPDDMLAFGGSGLDRAAHLRRDTAALQELVPTGLFLPLWHGKPLADTDGALVWLPNAHPVLDGAAAPVFLGLSEGVAHYAQDVSHWAPPPSEAVVEAGFLDPTRQHHRDAPDGSAFCELRSIMVALAPAEGELAATAKAVLGWHVSHRFCATCGAASEPVHAGWQRDCASCGAHHFPRTDPVVIMLVTRGSRALMGRSPAWPEGMFSCLAGFVEPGETAEAAVRREVLEETAVRIGAVRYVTSQPWPFPASLMMGFVAEAETDEITLDPVELDAARWVSRDEMMQVMTGDHPTMRAARKGSIAHHLLIGWLAGRLV